MLTEANIFYVLPAKYLKHLLRSFSFGIYVFLSIRTAPGSEAIYEYFGR